MWKLGYMRESERLLYTVMDTIQKQCLVSWWDECMLMTRLFLCC
jgi:myosin-5